MRSATIIGAFLTVRWLWPWVLALPSVSWAATNGDSAISLDSNDRVLVLSPHPDDETIGCGGIIQRAIASKAAVRVVYLTYGDSNEWSFMLQKKHPVLDPSAVRGMGMIRHDEAVSAGATLGLKPDSLVFLGYPDFSSINIWYTHWGKELPCRSILTHANSVPYNNAYRPGARYKGEEVLKDLTAIFREFKPTKVFVSHPADRNTDHLAMYLFTQIVLWDLDQEMEPALYPYLVHYRKWPEKRGFIPDAPVTPPAQLSDQITWNHLDLLPSETACKNAAMKAHTTQYRYSSNFMESFVRRREIFGDFPVIVLSTKIPPRDHLGHQEVEVADSSGDDELTEEDRSKFTGITSWSARWEGKDLVLSVELSRPIGEAVSVSLYVFGYRKDRSFAQMPKLHVRLGAIRHEVMDQTCALPDKSVTLIRNNRGLSVRIPGALMGDPERLLTNVRTYLAEVPLDGVAWRTLQKLR